MVYNRVTWTFIAVGITTACAGDDPARFGQVSADPGACPNGGETLLVNGRPQITVCNGIDGTDGTPGAPGAKGETGATGPRGVAGAMGLRGENARVAGDIVQGIEERASSIVIVECSLDGTSFAHGTGTKTLAGTVYTAEHVVNGTTSCEIFSESPIALLGSVTTIAQKGERDQVELTVDWTATGEVITGIAPQLATLPVIGDFVAIVGHPGLYDGLTLEHQYTTGLVTATNLRATFDSVPVLAGKATAWETGWSTDATAWHGNSGGPAFDAGGQWIGMLVGAFNGAPDNEGPDLNVVIPLF